MTNAHVAGTTLGRRVEVDVESTGDRIPATVLMAAYSDRTATDWSLLRSVNPYKKVEPVKLYKNNPTGGHYTKGFPRCRAHSGTDIQTVEIRGNLWFWEPDAIGGQSGSGVFNDDIVRSEGLLTWQWGQHGAGQTTASIYAQARDGNTMGSPRPPGLVPLPHDYDLPEGRPDDDPTVENGFFAPAGIQDLPIWWEAPVDPPPPPGDEPDNRWREFMIEHYRAAEEFAATHRKKLEAMNDINTKPLDPNKVPDGVNPDGIFGF